MLNREQYFNKIESELQRLTLSIKNRSKLNLLDANNYAENFFAELLNIIYDYNLINANNYNQNIEGIDLIDRNNKVVIQVSSTYSKQKIDDSLKKVYSSELYDSYHYKFLSISSDVNNAIRQKNFDKSDTVTFNPKDDILDYTDLLRVIKNLDFNKLEQVYELCSKDLRDNFDVVKLNSNLAHVVNVLYNEDLIVGHGSVDLTPFEIDKKIDFNDLSGVRYIIDEYKAHYALLDNIYSEFDKAGANRSLSIFQQLKSEYIKLRNKIDDSSEVFYKIVENVINIVKGSKNYDKNISIEELSMCVCIIVVDAFVRCKIFKNPEVK